MRAARAGIGGSHRAVTLALLPDVSSTVTSSPDLRALPLLPCCSKLTEVQNDVQEVLDAIGDVVNDDTEVSFGGFGAGATGVVPARWGWEGS